MSGRSRIFRFYRLKVPAVPVGWTTEETSFRYSSLIDRSLTSATDWPSDRRVQ